MTKAAIKEYIDEREGIRMYSGNQSEFLAIKGAESDLKNYLSKNNHIDEVSKTINDPFTALKTMFDGKST